MSGASSFLRKAKAFLLLQARIAMALARKREEGFSGIKMVHGIVPERPILSKKTVASCAGAWMAVLSRLGWRAGCLRRSMVMAEVLRREGHDARVMLGAARDGGRMKGHSWVEVGGLDIGGGSGGHLPVWGGGD